MRAVVLDPKNRAETSDLFIVSPEDRSVRSLPFDYAPEIHYDETNGELVVLQTRFGAPGGAGASHWLEGYCPDAFVRLWSSRVPPRSMFTALPGRGAGVSATSSGRYLYFLEQTHDPTAFHYRLVVHRYDRSRKRVEAGSLTIDSCVMDFGSLGDSDDELFIHMNCERPSSVGFGRFDSASLAMVTLEHVAPRTYDALETCGSWLDRARGVLFCVTRNGRIHLVRRPPETSHPFLVLPLEAPRVVPNLKLHGGGGSLFAGVSVDEGERALGLASEVWQISLESAEVVGVIDLPIPFTDFECDAGGEVIVGVNAHARAVVGIDVGSRKTLWGLDNVGDTPAQVRLIP